MNPLNEPIHGVREPALGGLDRVSDQRANDGLVRQRQRKRRKPAPAEPPAQGGTDIESKDVGDGHVDVLA